MASVAGRPNKIAIAMPAPPLTTVGPKPTMLSAATPPQGRRFRRRKVVPAPASPPTRRETGNVEEAYGRRTRIRSEIRRRRKLDLLLKIPSCLRRRSIQDTLLALTHYSTCQWAACESLNITFIPANPIYYAGI